MRMHCLLAAVLLLACGGTDPDPIEATGTVEVDEVDVAPLQMARLLSLRADEGDQVRRGDTLAVLTQSTLPAELAQREARLAAAEAALREMERGARPARIDQAAAELRALEAEATRLEREAERARALIESGAVSEQQVDKANAAAASAAGRRDAARDALQLLQEGNRAEQVQQARAEAANARAAVAAVRANANDLVLTAPMDGAVLDRHARPGEVLGPGEAVLTLGEVSRPWVRIYVSQAALPLVRVGQPATAVLDAFPERRFRGRVVALNDRAEFTPRVALTEDERDDLLFGVKVALTDSAAMLKPGLPVTVRLAATGDSTPARTAGAP